MPDYYLTFLYNPLAPRNFTVFVWESNVKYVISVRQLFWKKIMNCKPKLQSGLEKPLLAGYTPKDSSEKIWVQYLR